MKTFGQMLGKQKFGSCSEKLLGINIDRELSFNYHVSNLCIKAGRKISSRLMSFDQRRLLMKCMYVYVYFAIDVISTVIYILNIYI